MPTPPLTNDERAARREKFRRLLEAGVAPYPERFDRSHSLVAAHDLPDGTPVTVAGRLMTWRDMGKLTFAHLQDFSGQLQIALKLDELGVDSYKLLGKIIDLGDFLGIQGELFTTKKGERTILAKGWTFLGKAFRPLPEKWHGLADQETKYRQRYLDLIDDRQTLERFVFRSNFVRALREFYWREGFLEVETPTFLQNATGAAATPYRTHNNALDIDIVLRISHELPLKELIVGGFEKIFELGKAFRNEGHDPSHLPEHTHLEHYCAYWNFEDNITFTERMFAYLFDVLGLPSTLPIKDKAGQVHQVDFSAPWPRIDYLDLLYRETGLNLLEYATVAELRTALGKKKISIEGAEQMSLATLVDNVFKKVARPKIVNPTILYHYPKFLQPLARTNDTDSRIVDQFQLIINGWEIVKAYSELVDPVDQRQRFEEQKEAIAAGDEEAMDVDDEYLTAMEHGMPPISGWGMGVDRLLTLLTGQDNLRDVVLFPLMKPKEMKVARPAKPKGKTIRSKK